MRLTSSFLTSTLMLSLVTTAALAGCKKSKAEGQAAASTAVEKPIAATTPTAAPATMPGTTASSWASFDGGKEFARWDMAARMASLDGIWGDAEDKQIWQIAGDKVTSISADGTVSYHVGARSPCLLLLRADSADEQDAVVHFAFDGHAATVRNYVDYGERHGGDVLGCIGFAVYESTAAGCRSMSFSDDAPQWKPETCAIGPDADDKGKSVWSYTFESDGKPQGSQLAIDGEYLGDPEYRTSNYKRFDSLDAAKAVLK